MEESSKKMSVSYPIKDFSPMFKSSHSSIINASEKGVPFIKKVDNTPNTWKPQKATNDRETNIE
jgi:hypothetical protein